MAKTTALKKPSLVSAKKQSAVAKVTPKVRFGKYDPDAKLRATDIERIKTLEVV